MSHIPTLRILVGPPGSGKTTYARYITRTELNWFRICRDDVRAMQFGDTRLDDEDEIVINDILDAMIHAAIHKKQHVLLDATHCRYSYIQHFIDTFTHKANIDFKVFDIPLVELFERCDERYKRTGKYISHKTIKKFQTELDTLKQTFHFQPIPRAERHFVPTVINHVKPLAFIVDLDGTIAQAKGRSMYRPEDEEILADIPIEPVVKVIQKLAETYNVLFLSGREDIYRESTLKWLRKNVFPDSTHEIFLWMRKTDDFRRDSVIKNELLKEEILPVYHVLGAFDDRLQVIRECWNKNNIFCFNVNQFMDEY